MVNEVYLGVYYKYTSGTSIKLSFTHSHLFKSHAALEVHNLKSAIFALNFAARLFFNQSPDMCMPCDSEAIMTKLTG